MTSRLSYEDVRRLARTWFAEAKEKSDRDEAEISTWKKAHRKWNSSPDSGSGFWDSGDSGGDCGGGD